MGREAHGLFFFLLLAVPAHGVEPELLATQPAGSLAVETERILRVDELAGTLVLRFVDGDVFDYAATAPGTEAAVAVELWAQPDEVLLRPQGPCHLDVDVPRPLDVVVGAHDAVIEAHSLAGRIDVGGSNLRVLLRGVLGSSALEIAGGSVTLDYVAGPVRLTGSDLDLRSTRSMGPHSLRLERGSVQIDGLVATLDAELADVAFRVRGGTGDADIEGQGGEVELIDRDGNLRVDAAGTAVSVQDCRGRVDVATDAVLRVARHEGDVEIVAGRAEVEAIQLRGRLGVSVEQGGAVTIQDASEDVRLAGDDLTARIERVAGALAVTAARSSIEITQPRGTVEVSNDDGKTTIRGAAQRVTLRQDGGSIHLAELSGPVDARVGVEELSVGWSGLNGSWETTIENSDGAVRLGLPAGARVAIRAVSDYGEISTSIPQLEVSQDGATATGLLGGGAGGARISVHASHTVEITRGGS